MLAKKAAGLKVSLQAKAMEFRRLKTDYAQLLKEKEEREEREAEQAKHAAHEKAIKDTILVRMTNYIQKDHNVQTLPGKNIVSHSKASFEVDRKYCGCQQAATPDPKSRSISSGQCGTLDNWQQQQPSIDSKTPGEKHAQLREPTVAGTQIPSVFASLIDKPASSTRKALVVITGKRQLSDEECKQAGLSQYCCEYIAQPFTAAGSEFSLEASELALKEMWFFQKNQDTYSQRAEKLFQLVGPRAGIK